MNERIVTMKAKSLLALILVGAALISSGCKKAQKDSASTDGNVSSDTDEYTKDLAAADYDGYNFRILIRPGKTSDQYLEEKTGDVVDDAVYTRNKLVESMYNITISATESSDSGSETDALNSILAGDDAYDAIFPHSRAAFSYATQGAVENFNDIKSIHLDKLWWSKDIVDSANINGYLYVLDGDISLHRLSYAMCMYFNKRIFDELGLSYPYDMVKNGTWTFDEFQKLVKKGAKDLNGDGVITPEDDQLGFYTQEWQSPISILYTGGQRIYSKDDEGIPVLTLNTSKTVDIFDKYFDLMDTDATFLHFTNKPTNYNGTDVFTTGRAMFADGGLGNAKSFRNMDDNFGILPLPKFTEDDNYATVVNGHAHLLVMPITTSDPERTGSIIEALCAIGSRDVVPAFYNVSLKTKYSRDTESEEMIDIIRDSIIYDIGYVSGGTFQSIGRDLARSTTHDFSSTYAASESIALSKLKDFNKAYGHIE